MKVCDAENIPQGMPAKIVPDGLTDARKKYLFQHIRQYCTPETKDLLCPCPENYQDTSNQTMSEAEVDDHGSSRIRCGYNEMK